MTPADPAQAPQPVLDPSVTRDSGVEPVRDVAGALVPTSSPSQRRDRGRAVRRSLLVADLTALAIAFVALQLIFPAQAMDDRLSLDGELDRKSVV